jgi:hypothetical protein
MKTDKQQILELIERLPDEVSAETIMTELQFRITILRRGDEAERRENIVSHDEAKRRLSRWSSSTGT